MGEPGAHELRRSPPSPPVPLLVARRHSFVVAVAPTPAFRGVLAPAEVWIKGRSPIYVLTRAESTAFCCGTSSVLTFGLRLDDCPKWWPQGAADSDGLSHMQPACQGQ